MSRDKRLNELRKVPLSAAIDHRFFLDEHGNDSRLSKLPREERRKIKADGLKLSKKYVQIMRSIWTSGVGFPVDKLLRRFAVEYTHRYASSGVMNQPVSFNYFEPFCAIRLIDSSVAPYAEPIQEINHLFNVPDYFDFLTSEETPEFSISDLKAMPEGRAYHFTQNGSINDFTYMTAEGREFVISGFSLVRRGNSIHWYVLGGELLSELEWQDRSESPEVDTDHIPAAKRSVPFREH